MPLANPQKTFPIGSSPSHAPPQHTSHEDYLFITGPVSGYTREARAHVLRKHLRERKLQKKGLHFVTQSLQNTSLQSVSMFSAENL
jgi:hypothetical protein